MNKALLWNKLEFIFSQAHIYMKAQTLIYTLNDHIGGLQFYTIVTMSGLCLKSFSWISSYSYLKRRSLGLFDEVLLRTKRSFYKFLYSWQNCREGGSFVCHIGLGCSGFLPPPKRMTLNEWMECLIQLNLKCTLWVCASWLLVFAVRCVTFRMHCATDRQVGRQTTEQ